MPFRYYYFIALLPCKEKRRGKKVKEISLLGSLQRPNEFQYSSCRPDVPPAESHCQSGHELAPQLPFAGKKVRGQRGLTDEPLSLFTGTICVVH